MKKIPTLFKREFEGHNIVNILPEVTPGFEWVLDGEGDATVKWDGSCCAIIDGKFYVRYDAKNGKPIPENAIKCQEEPDSVTGHLPCWIPYDDNNKGQKWFGEAYAHASTVKVLLNWTNIGEWRLADGTYEAIGKHFNGNMYNLEYDTLKPHGVDIIEVPRTFEGIREYLKDHFIEGIVFWKDGEPQCKIKRTDFGFEWQPKRR